MTGKHAGLRSKAAMVRWKSIVPVLYDWFANHHLVWPSLSCRWGPVIERHTFKTKQRIYLSEQTDGSVPNTLVVSNVEVVKPRVAAAEHISQFNEDNRSPFVRKFKTIIHPGEVNRIRELPSNSNIIATHTDSPEVYIWNLESQPFRNAAVNSNPSIPDLVLTGHSDNAEFALSLSSSNPYVLSGGKDKNVLLWSIEDHITSLLAKPSAENTLPAHPSSPSPSPSPSSPALPPTPKLHPRGIFQGHTNTIEDIQFHPTQSNQFCSVGDDSLLLFWDERAGNFPVISVDNAHDGEDVHCVDWNAVDEHLILTASADNSVKLFDRRKVNGRGSGSDAVHTFRHHTEPVLCVQWCPDKSSVFGSGAEDGLLNIWDINNIGGSVIETNLTSDKQTNIPPPELMFQHIGHRDKILDFHWNVYDPWTIVSVAEEIKSGGGNLQLWRISDLIHRSKEEVLNELNNFPTVFPIT